MAGSNCCCLFTLSCRSTDYGHSFVNETDKLDNDAVIEWYYISPRQNNVSVLHIPHDSHMTLT